MAAGGKNGGAVEAKAGFESIEVAADIRAIFNAPDKTGALAQLAKAVTKYDKLASRLSRWLEENILEGLTVYGLMAGHRRLLPTTNGLAACRRENDSPHLRPF